MDEEYRKDLVRPNSNNGKDIRTWLYRNAFLQDKQSLEHQYHNDKISRLIRNLHANGLSENTDAEENSKRFVNGVLYSDNPKSAWFEYQKKAFDGDYEKDNTSIFKFVGKKDVDMAKALSILLERSDWRGKRVGAWKKFVHFRYENDNEIDAKYITPEYISFCYYVNIEARDVFLMQIRYFNSMKVVGNLKKEPLYTEFLKKYLLRAYMLGYMARIEEFQLEYLHDNDESVGYTIEYLENIAGRVDAESKDLVIGDRAGNDLCAVRNFIQKNIEILKFNKEA